MHPHVFREYDIRGVAEQDLTSEVVTRIGRGLGQMLAPDRSTEAPKLVVGRDCRLSSQRIFEQLVHGLVTEGVEVTDIGVGPTPMMYFAVRHLNADGGIMITGSHNPGEDNGFKMVRGHDSFFGAALQELKQRVSQSMPDKKPTGGVQTVMVDDAYVTRLRDGIHLVDPNFVLLVDAGNGSAGPLGTRALRACGLKPIELFCDMDGRFPNHHPDPTVPENLRALMAGVKKEQARVGLAWDGDGDRLGIVDADGSVIWGDRLLALFARNVLRERPGATILGDVKCSQVLFDDVAKNGGKPIMWKTGHSLIKTKMKESGAALAGEMSGHFFFADRYYGYDDAIYAALRLCEILAREGLSVGELLADLPPTYSTPEIRISCPEEIKKDVVDQVREKLASQGRITHIDGVRVMYEDGSWGLVRMSNTGPIIVLRFEAPTESRLTELRREIQGLVEAAQRRLQT